MMLVYEVRRPTAAHRRQRPCLWPQYPFIRRCTNVKCTVNVPSPVDVVIIWHHCVLGGRESTWYRGTSFINRRWYSLGGAHWSRHPIWIFCVGSATKVEKRGRRVKRYRINSTQAGGHHGGCNWYHHRGYSLGSAVVVDVAEVAS